MTVYYVLDKYVDEALDKQLITLLGTCFTKPSDVRFKTQRYFNEMPTHRWYIKDEEGNRVVAHLAVHEKSVFVNQEAIAISGVAEVCVHPDYRSRGYVKTMLDHSHQAMQKKGMQYSVLFGRDEVYSSSGYTRVTNLFLMDKSRLTPGTSLSAMVRSLRPDARQWPTQRVELIGLTF
ncbi:GNAT family N-acetyltransferase [Vibrio sp. E150_011]